MTPKELYSERITRLTEEIRQLNKYNRLVVVQELSTIALAVGCVVAYTMWSNAAALVVLFIAAYVAIRWRDSRNSQMAEEKESLRNVYQKELNYLDGDFSGFAPGEQYVNPRHAFTLDLDIFATEPPHAHNPRRNLEGHQLARQAQRLAPVPPVRRITPRHRHHRHPRPGVVEDAGGISRPLPQLLLRNPALRRNHLHLSPHRWRGPQSECHLSAEEYSEVSIKVKCERIFSHISFPTSPFAILNCYYNESVQENISIIIKKKKELWKI